MSSKKKDSSIKKKIDSRLQHIANVLLFNASFIDNLGLLNGKMGIALFFYRYARCTGNRIFEEYAGELVDEIYEEINTNSPIDFANGLTGIGWGIEYLINNSFVHADTDDTLIEIDNSVYSYSLLRHLLLDNGNDMFGYGHYFISRLSGHEYDDDNLNTLFKKQHLIYLIDDCERILAQKKYLDFNIDRLSTSTINSFIWFLLEMHRLGIFPYKVEKLYKVLPGYIEECLDVEKKSSLTDQLVAFTRAVIPNVNDIKTKNKFSVIVNNYLKKGYGALVAGEELVNSFICRAWQQVVYGTYCFTNKKNIKAHASFKDVFVIIDNEEDWNKRLDGLNKNNIGLTGLAGLGLGLLAESGGLKAESREQLTIINERF